MSNPRERILLVESDPETCDLIARQTLQPLGYKVEVVGEAAAALQETIQFSPDVILANLNLPGLSGKDMLVALSSQGVDVPVIVLAQQGLENDVIQAFRLGASDHIVWPVREAEVVSAVERALKQVRARRERELLARQLKQTNQELQRRVRELTTITAIGKAVTSITDHSKLMDKIVEGAVYVTEADSGWLLLREERTKTFLLSACRNLPATISNKLNQPWEDGISSLVALSGEPLSISGEPLKRFKVARLGQSALVVPVKAKKEVIGLLVVVRKSAQPFGTSNQSLLEAVADYASISMLNARLFKMLEERVRFLQSTVDKAQLGECLKEDLLHRLIQEVRSPLEVIQNLCVSLSSVNTEGLKSEQHRALESILSNAKALDDVLAVANSWQQGKAEGRQTKTDLVELARQSLARLQPFGSRCGLSFTVELPSAPIHVQAPSQHLGLVFDSLLSNAIKYSQQRGQVTVKVERNRETGAGWAHVSVKNLGEAFTQEHLSQILDSDLKEDWPNAPNSGGVGISLHLTKAVIVLYGGKIWAESGPGKGTIFHFTLPIPVG